jgi:carbamoyltransferase
MNVLGLSAFGGTAAAAVVRNGVPIAAMRQERFSGKKNDAAFPKRAARACLSSAGLSERDLDAVVFYEKPLRRFERTIISRLRGFPNSARSFADDLFLWLGDRLWIAGRIAADLGVAREKVLFCDHHEAHAAAAFWPAACESAAILIADGEGEWATTSLARGTPAGMEILAQLQYPQSLSLLASAVASYCGLESRPGEPLLATLATHGEPRYTRHFEALLACGEDGVPHMPNDVFRIPWSPISGAGRALSAALGEGRPAGSRLRYEGEDRRDADIAASLQAALESVALNWARDLHRRTGLADLCFGGELAWNSALVARLARESPFERIFVPLDPGDGGAALGAALHAAQLMGEKIVRGSEQPFLGEEWISDPQSAARRLNVESIPDEIAQRLARGELVGWVRGRSEWGPRALGHRSLLADARSEVAVDRLRRQVKRREPWIAFSPAVLAERAQEICDVPAAAASCARAMLVNAVARAELREMAPSVVSGNGTTRPQSVSKESDPLFHGMLERFASRSGVPYVLHTSLNQRGDASVRGEVEALALMARTGLDALIVGELLYEART